MVILASDEGADTEGAFRAGLILDHDRLAPFLPKRIGEYPGRGIVGAAGRERHDQFYRALGPPGTRGNWKSKDHGRHGENGDEEHSPYGARARLLAVRYRIAKARTEMRRSTLARATSSSP